MKTEYIVVLVTCKDKAQAKKISEVLLEEKLIACANMILNVNSLFWWQGKIDRAQEVLMVLKSRRGLLPKIILSVKKNHSYSVPEIIALPIAGGNRDYLDWIGKETKKK